MVEKANCAGRAPPHHQPCGCANFFSGIGINGTLRGCRTTLDSSLVMQRGPVTSCERILAAAREWVLICWLVNLKVNFQSGMKTVSGRPVATNRANPVNDDDSASESSAGFENADDEEQRQIASCALHCHSLSEPSEKVLQGPGVGPGPRRFLGVIKPAMLYMWMHRWAADNGHITPSFTTFMRALRACRGFLRFRKSSGQHALCDDCVPLVSSW